MMLILGMYWEINKVWYHFSFRCEDIFITCNFFIFPFECCKIFKLVLTTIGVCFSYEMDDTKLKYIMENKNLMYFLLFDMHAVPRIRKYFSNLFYKLVTQTLTFSFY